jgi:putative flavoprotein involved in K+ transport
MVDSTNATDVVVIGGGQAALAVGFYLRRSGLSYVVLDDQESGGGAWRRGWESLRAFSPAEWSSLPGWLMPRDAQPESEFPSRNAVIDYLVNYESRYQLEVRREIHVDSVERIPDDIRLLIRTNHEPWYARAVISATGGKPIVPRIAGHADFRGEQLHSIEYSTPAPLRDKRVVVVGAGNSAAQIVAELTEPDAGVRRVTWATLAPPTFLPDEVDGRYLFDQATARYKAQQEGRDPGPTRSLGDIVMVAPVRAARERGTLSAVSMFERFTHTGVVWPDGTESEEDAIIWATGYRPSLEHLRTLSIVGSNGRVATGGAASTRSLEVPKLWLVGYGNWTGFASATLIGVGRSARATVQEINSTLAQEENRREWAGR